MLNIDLRIVSIPYRWPPMIIPPGCVSDVFDPKLSQKMAAKEDFGESTIQVR